MLISNVLVPALIILFGAACLGLLVRVYDRASLRRDKAVVAEYEAPTYLSPAELGYIVDNRFGNNEVLATLIVLMQKGVIKLVRHEPGDPLLTLGKVNDGDNANMDNAELTVLSWVRGKNVDKVSWKGITHYVSKAYGPRSNFHEEVKGQLATKGFTKRRSFFSAFSADYSFVVALIFTLVLAVLVFSNYSNYVETGFFEGYQTVLYSMASIVAIPLMVAAWFIILYSSKLTVYAYFVAAGRPLNMTGLFKHRWRDVAGYQLFVKTVEFSRLDADTNLMDPAMPYAVALGFRPDIDKMMDYPR